MGSRKSAAHALIIVEILALVVLLIFVVLQKGKFIKKDSTEQIEQENTQSVISEEETDAQSEISTEEPETQLEVKEVVFSEQVMQKLASMTLEEKVAQMFMITPEMLTNTKGVNVAGSATANAINKYPIGGLVYSAENFVDKKQVKELLSKTQQYSMQRIGLPMVLAVEEVGGKEHSPLATKNKYQIQSAITDIKDVETAKKVAGNISTYLTEVGITMNIVPFGSLAFSSDIATTSVLAAESVATYQEKGILTAVGVFPGVVDGKDLASWKETDALTFKSVVNAGCDSIIVGNILYKELTENDTTICSISENVVKYIREEMGFKGILITDSLSEEVVTLNYSSKEAAVAAVQAGMDMLCCPQNFTEAYQGIIDAVNDNEIKMETIDKSVGRILTQKMSETAQE